jgi:hypothetical protein
LLAKMLSHDVLKYILLKNARPTTLLRLVETCQLVI